MTTPGPSSSAPHATVVRGSAVWLPPGSPAITVGNYRIAGGLVYLGSAVPAAYAAIYEPALIDPRAPVRRVRLDQETPAEGQRPSYADLTPGARAAYLEWLAVGRTGPTQAAHLWLFLYGLERRVLVDLAGTLGSQQEYIAIAAEVAALAERYPHATAFETQVADFTDLLDSLIGLNDPDLQPPPIGPRLGTLPMRLRVGIGRYIARTLPISASWAYSWYAYSPYRRWGAEATRRPDEFRRAFEARYAQAYPSGGLRVPMPAEALLLEYRPASPGFADRTVRVHTRLPDVGGLVAPLEELADLATLAEADLAGTARPVPPPTAPSDLTWPPPAAVATAETTPEPPTAETAAEPPTAETASEPPAAENAQEPESIAEPTVEPPVENEPPIGPPSTAGSAGSAGRSEPVTPAEPVRVDFRTAATGTAEAGTAEAGTAETGTAETETGDAPFAGPVGTPFGGARVTLDSRPNLAAAEALLRLVTLTGIADGYVRAVRRHVVDTLALTATERQGLDDRLARFALNRPTVTVVRRRFAGLRPEQQRDVTDLFIAAAGAEGVLEPGQAAVVAAVFDVLGYGAAELQRRLGDLEIAAVVGESTVDTTVLDEEIIRRILADALVPAGLVDALVAPVPRYATC